MVSSARKAPSPTVVIFGQEQHRRGLDVAADLGAEQPQPDRREQAGVEREQEGAGHVHQALGAPRPASRPGCAPGGGPRAARAPSSRTTDAGRAGHRGRPRRAPRHGTPATARRAAAGGAWPCACRRPPTISRPRRPTEARPAAATAAPTDAAYDQHPARLAVRRGVAARRVLRAARRGRGRAGPQLAGGHGARTPPSRARSRRPAPMRAPGSQGAARADRGARADPDARRGAARRRRPSSRTGRPRARSTQPSPSVSRPVTGGRVCRSTSRPDLGPQRPCVVGDPRRAGQVDRRRPASASCSAEPQPQVHAAAARIVAGPDAAQQQPGAERPRCPSGPTGLTNSEPAEAAPTTTTPCGAQVSTPRPCSRLFASASRYVSQRSADRGRAAARRAPVWTACARRGVGTTRAVAGRGAGRRRTRSEPVGQQAPSAGCS